jgi:hypothetical protein
LGSGGIGFLKDGFNNACSILEELANGHRGVNKLGGFIHGGADDGLVSKIFSHLKNIKAKLNFEFKNYFWGYLWRTDYARNNLIMFL